MDVFVVGDLHFGHKNICNFRKGDELGVHNEEEHRELVIKQWNTYVSKRDLVFVLGDAVFKIDSLEHIGRLKGQKVLVRGNHDVLNAASYLKVFRDVAGLISYKGRAWLSHAPIHPQELRGKVNIHGHVHNATIQDANYRNVSLENTKNFAPVDIIECITQPEYVLKNIGIPTE